MREDRIARNEALFRELNDRVHELQEDLSAHGVAETQELGEYFCECGLDDCVAKIEITQAEYEAVRASPIRFAVKPEHLIADVERIVAQNERFALVEKRVGEREIALDHKPPSR